MALTTEATAEVKAIFSVVDQASAPIQEITKNLNAVATAAKDVSADIPHSLAEVAARSGVAWRPSDVVAPITPAVTDQVTAAASAIAPAVTDQITLATAAIDKVSGHWTKLRDGIDKIAGEIGTKLRSAFESVENVAGRVVSKIAAAWEGLGGTLAAFGLGGLIEQGIEYAFHGMEHLVEEVEKLRPRASAIGITIAQLQDLNRWADDAGVSTEALDKVLTRLTATLGQVQAGGNKPATEALADLDVHVTDAAGALRSTVDVLPEVIDALNAIPDPTRRAADAAALFKLRWGDVAPLMGATSDAMAKAREEQEKIGHISEEQAQRANEWAAAHKRMDAALLTLQDTIGSKLLPAMTPLADAITTIAGDFNKWAESADGAAASMRFATHLADDLKGASTALGQLITGYETLSGWQDTLIAKASAKGPTIPDLLGNLTPEGVDAAMRGIGQAIVDVFEWVWSKIGWIVKAIGDPLAPLTRLIGAVPAATEAATAAAATGATEAATKADAAAKRAEDALAEAQKASALAAPPAGAAPGTAPVPNGTVNVNITHANPPPGTTMNVSSQGNGLKTTAQTGWSMPQIQAPWAPPPAVAAPWAPPA